jgi:hypothetical protein
MEGTDFDSSSGWFKSLLKEDQSQDGSSVIDLSFTISNYGETKLQVICKT